MADSASALTSGFASRGSSYTNAQIPMFSERLPLVVANTTLADSLPFILASIVASVILPCMPRLQSTLCSITPRLDCWNGLSETTRTSAESSFHLLKIVTASAKVGTITLSGCSTISVDSSRLGKYVRFSQYNTDNREPPFVLGSSAMQILVPWKPVVIAWGLLSA